MEFEDFFNSEANKKVGEVQGTNQEDPKIQKFVDGKVKRRQAFEEEVFSYLYVLETHRKLKAVYPFENMCVDGAIKLTNDKAIILEIKHSLGWLRACNARVQIQRLRKDVNMWNYFTSKVAKNIDGALIVFKEFSGDWKHSWLDGRSKFQKGWHQFYAEEKVIGDPNIPIRIAQKLEKLDFGVLNYRLEGRV